MSLKWKVLVSKPKKSMFALILISISFQIFASGQFLEDDFKRNSIHDFDLVNSNLQNLEVQASGNAQPEKLFRLPNDVIPILYSLKMVPNLFGNFDFIGEVNIDLKVEIPTTKVVLNCYQLNISSVEIFRNKRKLETNYTVSSTDQIVIIHTKQKMFRSNDIRLNVTFNGILNDEMIGFYRSSYKVGNTTK